VTEADLGPMSDPTYPIPPFSFNGLLAAEIVIAAYAYWFASRRIAPLRLPAGTPAATRSQITRFAAGLASGEVSVKELAQPFDMSLPAVSKHLKVLESAGLIAKGRQAQWRPCRLEAEPLREVADWVERYFREARLMRIAPISQEMVLNYVAEHVLGLPRSY